MKNNFILILLMATFMLGACTSNQSNSPEVYSPQMERHGQAKANLYMHPMERGSRVYVEVRSAVAIHEQQLESNIISFLQSEIGARPVQRPENADYRIQLRLQGVRAVMRKEAQNISAGRDVLFPAIVGASIGGSVGSLAYRRHSTFIGTSIGAALGVGYGIATSGARAAHNSSLVWLLDANLTVTDRQGLHHSTPLSEHIESAEEMSVEQARSILENNLAWTVVNVLTR